MNSVVSTQGDRLLRIATAAKDKVDIAITGSARRL